MVRREDRFRHGLSEDNDTQTARLRSVLPQAKMAGAPSDLNNYKKLKTYCFSGLSATGLRLRSAAAASRLTAFETSRTAANCIVEA